MLTMWVLNPEIDLDHFATAILAPVLALTGPVLGFYFNHHGD
jgi:hypothetical protein